jgi:cell filamentation protein
MARFEPGLLREHTPCRSAPLPEVARRIAVVHAELLLIHPFREGNGRLARWLADLMALQAACSVPDYGFRGRGSQRVQARYLEAVKQGYLGDYPALTGFFREAIERRLRFLG